MASDNLSQLGKILQGNRQETGFNTRRVSLLFPLIERLRDFVGSTRPYRMEFYMYNQDHESITLNMNFFEVFDQNAIADITTIPITISETGNGVGLEGGVGIEGVWYPLIFLGDLNFEWDAEYTVVLDISTYGTGTYQHKIVFDGGGVDLTDESTITSTQITIPIVRSNVISPPNTILTNAYIYGRALSLSAAGWLHYDSATIYQDGVLYAPRIIPNG